MEEVGEIASRASVGGLYFEEVSATLWTHRLPVPLPCGARPRVLLEPTSGAARGGEVVALLGASGAGKTTLLDALARRGAGAGLSRGAAHYVAQPAADYGSVPGRAMARSSVPWRRLTAYVTQDDVLHPSLTVYETLLVAAMLRLPSSIPLREKRRRVGDLLRDLGLEHVAGARVGGGLVFGRGISGGEMRRLSVAVEMVTDPRVLFLDEPTSGLDASAAFTLVSRLRGMARERGTAVVLSVHQPSSRVFHSFDRVLLLAPRGRCVFFGAPADLAPHLAACGFPVPLGFNAADFALDLVAQPEPLGVPPVDLDRRVDLLRDAFLLGRPGEPEGAPGGAAAAAALVRAVRTGLPIDAADDGGADEDPETAGGCSARARGGVTARRAAGAVAAAARVLFAAYANNAVVQFLVLLARNVVSIVRDPFPLLQLVVTYLISAVMIALLFSDLKRNKEEQLTLGLGFVLDVVGIQAFFAVPSYTVKRAIFQREHDAGSYRTSVYMLTNLAVTLPLDIAMTAMYGGIVFYAVGLNGSFVDFLTFLLVIFLQMEFYLGINEAIGAMFRHIEIAIGVAGLVMIFLMSFSGVMVQFNNIPWYLRWGYWASPQTYAMSALMLLQFDGDAEGKLWVDSFGVQVRDLWLCVGILAACVLSARAMLFVVLVAKLR